MNVVLVVTALSGVSIAAEKEVSYPKVRVEVNTPYKPDAAFNSMRSALAQAIAEKNQDALSALVNHTFIWTQQGQLADELDLSRDALHNFKVVFGFRAPGKDMDGAVENGPFWNLLAAFAADETFSEKGETGNLVCGPAAADVADEEVFERAREMIEKVYPEAEWYFTRTETEVIKSPQDPAILVKIDTVALPVLSTDQAEGRGSRPATHLQVLLPSGQSGWVAVSAVRPLFSGRLCYARGPDGNWRIAMYDEGE